MSSVQKYKFNRGDFFVEDKKVDDRLDEDLKKYVGQQLSIEEVCQLSENILSEIKKDFNTNLDFTFTVYKGGDLYLDFFTKDEQRVKQKKEIKIPQEILDTWNEYQQKRVMYFYKETHKNGYWETKNKEISAIELRLRYLINKNFGIIKQAALSDKRKNIRQMSAYLFNWYDNKKNALQILLQLLNDPEHIVHNETARAIIGISNKISVPKKIIFNLLSHKNSSCKNKALGMMLETEKLSTLNEKEIEIIRKCTKSHQPNNYKFAKMILRKIKSSK